MRFTVLPKVSGVRIKGVSYPPGSIVDLPEKYLDANWLEPVPEPAVKSIPEPIHEPAPEPKEETTDPEPNVESKLRRRKKVDAG